MTSSPRRSSRLVRAFLLTPALAGVAACASSAPSGDGGAMTTASADAPSARIRRSGDVITHEEIAQISASTAHDVVEQLRPTFLRSRTVSTSGTYYAIVYLNGQRYGELQTLQTIPVGDIQMIRRLSAADAQSKYGAEHFNGVIEVWSKNARIR